MSGLVDGQDRPTRLLTCRNTDVRYLTSNLHGCKDDTQSMPSLGGQINKMADVRSDDLPEDYHAATRGAERAEVVGRCGERCPRVAREVGRCQSRRMARAGGGRLDPGVTR